jgi:hypothetical protein
MRRTLASLTTGIVVAGLMTAVPAHAAPIDQGHETFTGSNDFTCDTIDPAIPTRDEYDVRINFLFNQRGGPNVFPYYRESVSGTHVYTNETTGGTYSQVFTANSQDHKIIDNGDGTITIIAQGTGAEHWKDTNGNIVLRGAGQYQFSVDIDYNGTPGNPDDDVEVPDSFRLIHSPTGHDDFYAGPRDFCADLLEFTS